MDEASRLGGRGSRWGFDGCDWLAMQLDFAFGGSAACIAERHGVSEDRVKARARTDGWRRDHSDKELLEMMCSVQLARVHEAMREGQDGKQVSRSKSLRSLQLAAECERARERIEAERAREIEAEREQVKAESGGDDERGRDDETSGGAGDDAFIAPRGPGWPMDELRERVRLVFERHNLAHVARDGADASDAVCEGDGRHRWDGEEAVRAVGA